MKINKMSKFLAEEEFLKLKSLDFEFNANLDSKYKSLREELLQEYRNITYKSTSKYYVDLHFGFALYRITNKYFNLLSNISIASDIEFWIYINMCVIPDLTFDRWGPAPHRFYKHTKRVWSNSLWWYIHLSWQGTEEKTIETIKNFNTDTIVALIERTSGKGYNLQLTREIIKQLSTQSEITFTLRKVMVLNTIYYKNVEPSLYKGGYEGYVSMLFNKAKS